jgi:hypothetical protein
MELLAQQGQLLKPEQHTASSHQHQTQNHKIKNPLSFDGHGLWPLPTLLFTSHQKIFSIFYFS